MHRLLCGVVLAVVLTGATRAQARIGETEAELVARFGAVQARKPERALERGRVFVVGERVVLQHGEWRVAAVLIDRRCARICYTKTGAWTEEHYEELLARNAGRWTWTEVTGGAPKWQRTWRRSDGLVAKWMYVGGFTIEAQPFVDARARARGLVAQQSTTVAPR